MRENRKNRAVYLCRAGIIAALYVALTYLSMLFGLDKNAIQVRFSEALCVLPAIFPEAVGGLAVGCLLANILTGAAALDIAIGPVATLVGAVGAYLLGLLIRKRGIKSRLFRCLVPLPNIIANTVTVPMIIYICYTAPSERTSGIIAFFALTVFAGEVISAGVLGMLLYTALEKKRRFLR